MVTKQCPKCKEVKEQKDFNKSTSRNDRMAVYCKKCENDKRKKRHEDKKFYARFNII